jgi:hypothetical protein
VNELTSQELETVDAFTQAWRKFVALPRCHPNEVEEGTRAIHELQTLVMLRAAVRAHPHLFNHVEGFE